MPATGKGQTRKGFEKSLRLKNCSRKSRKRRGKLKEKSHKNTVCLPVSKEKVIGITCKGSKSDPSRRRVINKATLPKKSIKKQSSSGNKGEASICSREEKDNTNEDLGTQKLKRRRRHKRRKGRLELDDASRLQRRTKYLLIKMKLEQNLIDAYSTEGWKGQSREKIKPEKELQRAKKQILKCKLGIRDAIRQLDVLSSVGSIADSVIAPDGSVHHEHIICAKCKSQEAFLDNDIILCDGTCNSAFHQKCLDPPLSTENIPPGDQGWLCKFCDCKLEILESMNAHLGTHFSTDSSWQDIFKEEAALPDGEDALLIPVQEWPSDDSEDDDYDPENFGNSNSCSIAGSDNDASDEASSSSSLCSLEGEVFSDSGRPQRSSLELIVGVDSDETTDYEIISGRRQRQAVDYLKLNDVLFGKNAPENEQISEDEDWGPRKGKRRKKESDAANTLMALCGSEKNCTNGSTTELKTTDAEEKLLNRQSKRSFSRIPPNAVEKLRLAFAKNELPSRSVKENLSKQLGLDSEKVNKWFKNARYLSLKARKEERAEPFADASLTVLKDSRPEYGKDDDSADNQAAMDVSSEYVLQRHKTLLKFRRRKKAPLISSSKKKLHESAIPVPTATEKDALEFPDDVSLKVLRENAKREKKKVNFKARGVEEAKAVAEMERLCKMKDKVEKLQQVLLGVSYYYRSNNKTEASTFEPLPVIYVPVAELREKT